MAIPRIKATYSLDEEAVRALEGLSERWKVSKSEALRRAILAADMNARSGASDALASLDALQERLALTGGKAAEWEREVIGERRASSVKRTPGVG